MSSEWPDQQPTLPPNATEPPPPLLRAVNLMYVGAALGVIGLVLNLIDRDGLREQVRQSLADAGLAVTEEAINSGVALAMATGVFIGALTVGLWIFMAVSNKRGKSWARIVATVLGAISIVLGLTGLAAASAFDVVGPGGTIMSLIGIALSAAILFFLWRPENNPYYAYNSQRRV